MISLTVSGANARYLCISRDQLVKVPEGVDPVVAACLAENYLSAFQALHLGQKTAIRYRDNAMKGRSILVLDGTSCIGQALIELALAAGAEFVYATAKEKQFSAVSKLGAIPLSRNPQDWLTLIGRQISILVCVSNAITDETVTKEHLKALNSDGQVVFVGRPGMSDNGIQIPGSTPNPSKLICSSGRNKLADRSQSYNVFDQWKADQKQSKRDLMHLLDLLQNRSVNPTVLETIPLSKVAKAQSILESKRLPGYIVCEPWIQENFTT